jgi:hypothetical protein
MAPSEKHRVEPALSHWFFEAGKLRVPDESPEHAKRIGDEIVNSKWTCEPTNRREL